MWSIAYLVRKALGIVSLVVIGDKGHTRSGSTHMHMYCHFHPFLSLEKEAKVCSVDILKGGKGRCLSLWSIVMCYSSLSQENIVLGVVSSSQHSQRPCAAKTGEASKEPQVFSEIMSLDFISLHRSDQLVHFTSTSSHPSITPLKIQTHTCIIITK